MDHTEVSVNTHQVCTVCDVLEFLSNKCHVMPLYIFLQNSRVNAAIYFKVFNIGVNIQHRGWPYMFLQIMSPQKSGFIAPFIYFPWTTLPRVLLRGRLTSMDLMANLNESFFFIVNNLFVILRWTYIQLFIFFVWLSVLFL